MLPRLPSSMHAGATTPAETGRCPRRSLPSRSAVFPQSQEGRLPRCPFRGLLSVHSRSGLHGRRAAQGGPSLQSASAHVVTSMNRPGRYQPERQFAGWDSHPPGKRAFPRRTEISGLGVTILFRYAFGHRLYLIVTYTPTMRSDLTKKQLVIGEGGPPYLEDRDPDARISKRSLLCYLTVSYTEGGIITLPLRLIPWPN